MTRKVERFEGYKNLLNICYLIGFGLSLGVTTLNSMVTLPKSAFMLLQLVAVPFMLLWAVGLWRFKRAVRAAEAWLVLWGMN